MSILFFKVFLITYLIQIEHTPNTEIKKRDLGQLVAAQQSQSGAAQTALAARLIACKISVLRDLAIAQKRWSPGPPL
jgi:hypothetical protein